MDWYQIQPMIPSQKYATFHKLEDNMQAAHLLPFVQE